MGYGLNNVIAMSIAINVDGKVAGKNHPLPSLATDELANSLFLLLEKL